MDIRLAAARKHGLFGAIMIGLGSAIGFEVFWQLGYAYSLAQASMVFALFLGGLITLLTMFSYSELCATFPVRGGEYSYTKAAFGGFIAFMAGCLRWLSSVFGASFAAIVFAKQLLYFLFILARQSRSLFMLFPLEQNSQTLELLIAAILVLILGTLSVQGAKKITALIVSAFLAIFALFLVSGFGQGQGVPQVLPSFTFEGLSGVFAATAYTFIMFVGIRAIVAGAPEIEDPCRNIPKAMFLTTVFLIALYCSVAYVAVNVVEMRNLAGELENSSTPLLNLVADKIMGWPGGALIAVGGMVASVSSLSTAIMVQSSIVFGMSRDGYLPKVLQRVHRRFGTHHVAVVVNSFFILLFIALGAEGLGYAASFASILVFALVNLSVMRLRERRPHLERPFKAPFYPLTPIVGIVMSLMLLVFPLVVEDVNAENAIVLSLGLMGMVLTTYHIRMVGLYRLRVALGGISLGIGFFAALLAYLIENGFEPLAVPLVPPYILVFVSAVSILAGVLNIAASTR